MASQPVQILLYIASTKKDMYIEYLVAMVRESRIKRVVSSNLFNRFNINKLTIEVLRLLIS